MIKQRNQYIVKTFALGMLATGAIGCAANIPETQDARAAGEWHARLPTTPSTFGKLAFGSGGNSEPAELAKPEAQRQLLAAKTANKPERSRAQHPVLAPAPVATESAPLPTAEPAPAEPPVLVASNSESTAEQRYGARETETRKLQEFRGGDAIVISASALLLVLLIVILILVLR